MIDQAEFDRLSQAHASELFSLLNDSTNKANQAGEVSDKINIKREVYSKLITLLQDQKRVWDFHAGEKVDPIAHEVEAVLLPVMGGGSA